VDAYALGFLKKLRVIYLMKFCWKRSAAWDGTDTNAPLKVGGLGDVITGLSRSLQRKGHLVEAILPKYDCMDYSRIINLKACHLIS
jgi:hypothetical protein